jgi:GNAT superfamily N-acetyltransferase
MTRPPRIDANADPAALDELLTRLGQKEPVTAGGECWLAYRGPDAVAALATYSADDLEGAPGRTGLVGHYGAADDAAGSALLAAAAQALMARGAVRVLGPLNGNTWSRYRLVLAPESALEASEPPFLGEPWNPPSYVTQFESAGFSPVAFYESAVTRAISTPDARANEARARVADAGVTIARLELGRYEEALAEIYPLSVESFRDNLYYSPISRDEFLKLYLPVKAIVDPDLVLLARNRDGELVGFAFAYPDPLGASVGSPGRVVLKTLVSAPSVRGIGLGGVLVEEVRRVAEEKALRSVIHALMHVTNASRRISGRTTERFRRYALYEWRGRGS